MASNSRAARAPGGGARARDASGKRPPAERTTVHGREERSTESRDKAAAAPRRTAPAHHRRACPRGSGRRPGGGSRRDADPAGSADAAFSAPAAVHAVDTPARPVALILLHVAQGTCRRGPLRAEPVIACVSVTFRRAAALDVARTLDRHAAASVVAAPPWARPRLGRVDGRCPVTGVRRARIAILLGLIRSNDDRSAAIIAEDLLAIAGRRRNLGAFRQRRRATPAFDARRDLARVRRGSTVRRRRAALAGTGARSAVAACPTGVRAACPASTASAAGAPVDEAALLGGAPSEGSDQENPQES